MQARTLLLVDDEPHILLSLRYLFRTLPGVNILTAENGAQAVALAEEHRPCLILMDVMMPVLDGFEACRRIKAIPGYGERVAVWLVTARGERIDRHRGTVVGADDYITKPYDPDEFLRRVQEHLDRLATAEVSG